MARAGWSSSIPIRAYRGVPPPQNRSSWDELLKLATAEDIPSTLDGVNRCIVRQYRTAGTWRRRSTAPGLAFSDRIPLSRPRRHADRGRTVGGVPQRSSRAWTGGRSSSAPSISGPQRTQPEGIGDRVKTNPALGRRAIRLSLAEPKMFRTAVGHPAPSQVRQDEAAGIPMLAHAHEIDQTFGGVEQAVQPAWREGSLRSEHRAGGMIEIPAAALGYRSFLRRLDFRRSVPTT